MAPAFVIVQAGEPYRGSVVASQYAYFVFEFADVHMDVVFSVTPYTGASVTAWGL